MAETCLDVVVFVVIGSIVVVVVVVFLRPHIFPSSSCGVFFS